METIKRKLPFILWLLFCVCTVVWLLIKPVELSFDLQAERIFTLRVYDSSDEKSFDPKKSGIVTVTPWKTHYSFSMPGKTRIIRLKLGHEPGNRMTIRNFSLTRNVFRSQKKSCLSFRDLHSVSHVAADGEGFRTTGTEPYLEISPDSLGKQDFDIRRISLLLLVFLAVSFILLQTGAEAYIRMTDQLVSGADKLKNYCAANRYFLIYAFFCLLILYGFQLFNPSFTDDNDWYVLSNYEYLENSMPAAYSSRSYDTLTDIHISHGRWPNFIISKILTDYFPVVSLLLCLVCMLVVFLILSEKLSLPQPARYLLLPLFLGHPIFNSLFVFFIQSNLAGPDILMVFLAAVFWAGARSKAGIAAAVMAGIFAVGSYQSLILIFPLWFLLNKMSFGLDHPHDYRQSFIELLKLCGICLLILLGYFLSLKYSLWLTDSQWQYLGGLFQKPGSFRSILQFGKSLLKKMLPLFSGKFEFTVHGQLLLFLLMAGAVLGGMIRKKRSIPDIFLTTAALAGCLILPFTLDIVSFNTSIPVRSMLTFPIMLTGLCILGWRSLADCPKIRLAASLLIVFVAVQYTILINQRAYASKLRYEQDRSVLQSIKDRCYQIPEFAGCRNEKKKIPLAVVGNLIIPRNESFPMWSDSILNCNFEPAVVINLHLLGETYFYPASKSEMKKIFPLAMEMPSWPAAGSVRFENGIMIVKLSEFNAFQCREYGFPFFPVIRNNSILQLKKIPAETKQIWSLNIETLKSARKCKVDFEHGRFTVKRSEWNASLNSKAIQADPRKMYYLQIGLQNSGKKGFLYLNFTDSSRDGNDVIAEINLPFEEDSCILRVPGYLLEGSISILLGDLPGKENVFTRFVLLERTGAEKLTAD